MQAGTKYKIILFALYEHNVEKLVASEQKQWTAQHVSHMPK